jgi:hypothetical protein
MVDERRFHSTFAAQACYQNVAMAGLDPAMTCLNGQGIFVASYRTQLSRHPH